MTTHPQMAALIDEHIAAEMARDTAAAVTMYTPDVEHDVVGWPSGPVVGPAAAKGFYDQLVEVFTTEKMQPLRMLYGDDFCVAEHETSGRFPHGFLGAPACEDPITFRMLHVFEFRDAAISRENVWLDTGAIMAQLHAAAASAG